MIITGIQMAVTMTTNNNNNNNNNEDDNDVCEDDDDDHYNSNNNNNNKVLTNLRLSLIYCSFISFTTYVYIAWPPRIRSYEWRVYERSCACARIIPVRINDSLFSFRL